MSVLVGARCFAHGSLLRGDRALHALLGLERPPTDDTIRNLFRKFGMGQVQRLFEPLAGWQMQHLPQRSEGYMLDLDSAVLERYGKQGLYMLCCCVPAAVPTFAMPIDCTPNCMTTPSSTAVLVAPVSISARPRTGAGSGGCLPRWRLYVEADVMYGRQSALK